MLKYDPKNLSYPGDGYMRTVTAVPKVRRGGNSGKRKIQEVTLNQFKKEKRYKSGRCCGDLNKLDHHLASMAPIPTNKARVCAWCGEKAYTMCGVCKDEKGNCIALHFNAKRGPAKNLRCFIDYHNDSKFGLAKNDATRLLGQTKSHWTMPTSAEVKSNTQHIKHLNEKLNLR